MSQSLRSKAQFDKLSIENKESVLFFLNDRLTEDNVLIKLDDEGKLHSVYELSETELNEHVITGQHFVDKDILIYILS